ncbi:hypothetical protein [Blochmannia endosymbiont of Camponotus (Colobopsis) obliquus]|uniref:hypothetical protein n=1 Tax=Blochmannia endosymbiont of Camponotus (Colobopsis) obliquus TaxID=1505597 RepID=UPI00061B0D64|nr:hypothetical protein [Blochmannia endosymbiont of Camponotus (Colobopsis) obliquus]
MCYLFIISAVLLEIMGRQGCHVKGILLYRVCDELDKACFVVNCIKFGKNKGCELYYYVILYRKCSVLYVRKDLIAK